MERKVLVTGGAGFIGSHIAEELVARGWEVAVLDDLSTGKREQVPPAARFYERDITRGVEDVLEDFRPEVVLHQAAQVSVAVSMREPERDARINILGSIEVLRACRRAGVRKLLYASSAAAYGPLEDLPLRETQRPLPVSCYGTSKYTVEHYLRTAGCEWGLEWAALRYSNVYGPRQDPHGEAGVVAIFAGALLEGRSPVIFGDGEHTRDYVYVGDVARANLALLECDLRGHPDPVFNVSTETETATNRIYELVRRAVEELKPVSAVAQHGPPRPGDVRRSVLANAKLRDFTGWTPEVGLEEGLRRTVAYFHERLHGKEKQGKGGAEKEVRTS